MTKQLNLPALLPAVIAAAEAAGSVVAAEFARPDGPRGVPGHADVDEEIEVALREQLLALVPGRWRGEETGLRSGPGGPFCWLVDPHDGTSNFLAGERGSAVSIALLRDGVPVLGVVHAPLSPDLGADTIGWAEDLHIVYGPNEAGKSTAFAGFLDLLFGIEMQSRYGFLHPYGTMRVGGCLELSVGLRELVRIKRPQPTLRDAGNEPVAEGLILGDLGGLDRNAYRTMFSLDDDTLEAGGKSILASNGELGQLLFSASAGLSDLSKTLLDLRLETDGFTKRNARSGELQQLKASLVALKQERDAIDTLASEFNRLAAAKDGAAARYEAALAERAQAQAGLVRVQRLLAALPRMAALRHLRERLEPLAGVPEAPPGWLGELPRLQQDENRRRSEIELAEAEVKRLSDELGVVVVDERALRFVGRLDRLAELRARHVTADLDLPSRRRELARADGEVGGLLNRLGREDEQAPARLLLNAAQSAALNSLIVSRSGVEAKVMAAADELSQARHELTEAQRALQEALGSSSSPSLAPVISALAALRESDHSIRLRNADRARTQHSELLATRLAALAPWNRSVAELAELTVPDVASAEAWNAAAQRNGTLMDQRRDEVERLETELERRAAELDAIGKTAGVSTDQEAAAVRSAREAAWAEHRSALNPATADAFEAALRRDDIVCNARLGRERDVAKLHETTQALAVRRAEAGRARTLLNEAATQHQLHTELVARATADICPELSADFSPARLLGWMAHRDKALEAWGLLRQAEREIRVAEADAAALRDRLLDALGQAAVPFDPLARQEALAAAAEAAVEREARTKALRQAVTDCEREVRKREQAVQKADLADRTWLTAWHAACAACWLGEEAAALPFEAVREMLAAAVALGAALKTQSDLGDRIRGMEDDQGAFGRELEKLTSELGIDPGQRSRVDLAQAMVDSVQEASRAAEDKRRLRDAFAAAQDKKRQVEGDALVHARRVGEMTEFMKAGSLIELAGRLRDAEQKAELERQAVQAERDILAALHVENLVDAQALLAAQGESELELEQAALSAQMEDLDTRTRELFAATKQAADRIAAVGGDDSAARIEERRQTKLLEIEDKARHHLRLRVGIAAADRALRAYRDQHRSSMMTQASDSFRIISRGAYRGLGTQPDRDSDVLVALAADGSSKLAADLSKGTRFQLYLALRAAGYQEFAKLRPPVPFIADDIMETFDDFRAEETLRVFEEMARLGQVIYLTHHDHLRAIAERTIPSVRIHTLAAKGP